MRKLRQVKTKGANSLNDWSRHVSPIKVAKNYILISVSRVLPSLHLKRAVLRATGMKVGSNVSIGLHAMFDVFFPELITLEDGCIIGYNATILAHEFLRESYKTGNTVIGEGVMIGANSTVLAGVTIGKNSTVSAMSLVNKSLPANKLCGGVPCSVLRQ